MRDASRTWILLFVGPFSAHIVAGMTTCVKLEGLLICNISATCYHTTERCFQRSFLVRKAVLPTRQATEESKSMQVIAHGWKTGKGSEASVSGPRGCRQPVMLKDWSSSASCKGIMQIDDSRSGCTGRLFAIKMQTIVTTV